MTVMSIKAGYTPGDIGRITELHATYYSKHWGFGLPFEAKVASELAEFLGRYEKSRDGFWTARSEQGLVGSIAIDGIDGQTEGAHLRWFIVAEGLQGSGIGGRLMRTAVDFLRERGHKRIYLNTFEGLDAARHLYEKEGFRLVRQWRGTQWGKEVNEQRFERRIEALWKP